MDAPQLLGSAHAAGRSLTDSTSSNGVKPLSECLRFAEEFGYRPSEMTNHSAQNRGHPCQSFGSKAFIIVTRRTADMAFGVAAPGPRRAAKTITITRATGRALEDFFRAQIRDVVRQGIVRLSCICQPPKRRDFSRWNERLFRELCGDACRQRAN